MNTLSTIKTILENNSVAFATVMPDGKPNIVAVASVKVVGDKNILVTDNYMNQTVKDILNNKNVCLNVWDSEMHGYKIIGEAEYFIGGEWKERVEQMDENKGLPAKGAILISVSNIIESK